MSPLWHDAVEGIRTFCTLQNALQEHCKHNSDSGQQVSSLPDIAQEVIAVCLLHISALSGISQLVLAAGQV